MKINVLLADDHPMVRDGLRMILDAQSEIEVLGVAVNGQEAIMQAQLLQPDVIVMDISMPDMNGIESCGSPKPISAGC